MQSRSIVFGHSLVLPLLITLLFFSTLFSQEATFKSMADNGVLITESGDTILPYGVDFISMEQNNIYSWKFLNNMRQWLTDYFVNRSFVVVVSDTISSRKYYAKIFRERLVSSSDAIELIVLYGYAKVDSNIFNSYTTGLLEIQKKAIKEKNGMWRNSSKVLDKSEPKTDNVAWNNIPSTVVHKIDFPLLSISLLSFGLAYDFFVQVSDISDLIDAFHKIGIPNTGNLESEKTRKTILGVLSLFAGTVSFFSSWETIQIEGRYNEIKLRYNF
jgi:endonuclease YncB( thermonuclease family)